jgi:hypothetical protein
VPFPPLDIGKSRADWHCYTHSIEATTNLTLDRSFGLAEIGRHLRIRQVPVKSQGNWNALVLGEGGQSASSVIAAFFCELFNLRLESAVIDEHSGFSASPRYLRSNPIHGPTVSKPSEPRPKWTKVRLISLGMLPKGQHYVLRDVLCSLRATGDRDCHPKDVLSQVPIDVFERIYISEQEEPLDLRVVKPDGIAGGNACHPRNQRFAIDQLRSSEGWQES